MKRSNPTTAQIAALVVACAVVVAALSIAPLGIAVQASSNEHEPNDQPANATHIKEGVVVTGEVVDTPGQPGDPDRVDIYAFEANKGQHIVVNVTGLEDTPRPTQLTLSLHGPAYARGNDSTLDEIYSTLGTTTNKLIATAPVTGTYYVEVANEAAMGSSGRYAVSVNISGAVTTQSPTEINSCTVIDEPGQYVLTADIENSTVDQCIKIKSAQGIVLDGAGHTIDGVDDSATGGIVAFGRSGASNVTVTNVMVTDWGTGITYEATTGEIRNSVVASNSRGIAFTYQASGIVVANTTARGNNLAGFYVQDASGNLFVNDRASDNGWAYVSRSSQLGGQSVNNTVKNLALDSATVSFESKDIKLGAVKSPPTSPSDLTNVGGYVNTTSFDDDGDSYLALSVHYTDAAVANANVNESTLRLYAFSEGNWSPVPGSTVNTKKNAVSANITALANGTVLAPFGGDTEKTAQPSNDSNAPTDNGEDVPADNGDDVPSDDSDAPPDNGEDVPPDNETDAPPEDDGGDTPSDDGDAPPNDSEAVSVCEAGSTNEVFGENDEDDDGDGAIDEDDEDNDGPSNDDDDGDGAIDEDDECDDGDDGSNEFNGNAEDDDDGDGAVDEDDEPDSGNSDDVDNDGDGAVDEDDEADIDD